MRSNFISFLVCFSSLALSGQTTTLVSQPGAVCGKDALLFDLNPDNNYGVHPDFLATKWTNGGTPVTVRSLLAFDLNMIPPGTIILSATLELFHYNSTANIGHSTLSGSNEAALYRVTENWNENTVTWNSMPAFTNADSLYIPASTSTTQNYVLNVTTLIQDMVNDSANSFGFLFKLDTESFYRSMLFASSDEADPALHPKLTIVLGGSISSNDSCISWDTTPSTTPTMPIVSNDFILPNIFTPNNDGTNDVVDFSMLNLAESIVTIYNRWGTEIFETNTFNTKWDGKDKNGNDCSDGVYYYIQRSNGVTNKKYSVNGFIELLR